ncbi:hypothetical protein [Paraburkholderia hayleyella]|uniref:hypothetical protein n=1 Tax=Paraburkholderia hayleyella TaxID=2152889 RepID=UPI0012927BE5|nr:hypothetical protein [Paraburkholderia hayleyella]
MQTSSVGKQNVNGFNQLNEQNQGDDTVPRGIGGNNCTLAPAGNPAATIGPQLFPTNNINLGAVDLKDAIDYVDLIVKQSKELTKINTNFSNIFKKLVFSKRDFEILIKSHDSESMGVLKDQYFIKYCMEKFKNFQEKNPFPDGIKDVAYGNKNNPVIYEKFDSIIKASEKFVPAAKQLFEADGKINKLLSEKIELEPMLDKLWRDFSNEPAMKIVMQELDELEKILEMTKIIQLLNYSMTHQDA